MPPKRVPPSRRSTASACRATRRPERSRGRARRPRARRRPRRSGVRASPRRAARGPRRSTSRSSEGHRTVPKERADASGRAIGAGHGLECAQARRALSSIRIRQAAAMASSAAGALAIRGRAKARTASRSRSSVRYSTGDLPSIRASNSAGSSAAVRRSSVAPRFPCDVGPVALDQRGVRVEAASAVRGPPRALQQQVVQDEREVERGIAEPGAFGVEDHRPLGADQEVLGTEVAVDEHPSRRRGRRDQPSQRVREVGDAPGRSPPGRARGGSRGTAHRWRTHAPGRHDRRWRRGCGRGRRRRRGRPGCRSCRRAAATSRPDSAPAGASSSRRRRPPRRRRGSPGRPRGRCRATARNHATSCRLRPTGTCQSAADLEPREGTLDAERRPRRFDPPDVRGHAARQRNRAGTIG